MGCLAYTTPLLDFFEFMFGPEAVTSGLLKSLAEYKTLWMSVSVAVFFVLYLMLPPFRSVTITFTRFILVVFGVLTTADPKSDDEELNKVDKTRSETEPPKRWNRNAAIYVFAVMLVTVFTVFGINRHWYEFQMLSIDFDDGPQRVKLSGSALHSIDCEYATVVVVGQFGDGFGREIKDEPPIQSNNYWSGVADIEKIREGTRYKFEITIMPRPISFDPDAKIHYVTPQAGTLTIDSEEFMR